MNIDKVCSFVFNALSVVVQNTGDFILAVTALCIVWSCAIIVKRMVDFNV